MKAHFNKPISQADKLLNEATRNLCWSSDLIIGAEFCPFSCLYVLITAYAD